MKTVVRLMLPLAVMLIQLGFTAGLASAAVTGDCVNCHTMHNSQNGQAVADHNGTTLTSAQVNLLNSDCLGCHTDATQTIAMIGTGNQSRVPIVLTTSEPTYPPNGSSNSVLAAGNFYWVAQGDDTKGHNVFGLRGNTFAANVDSNLSAAPGNAQPTGSGSVCRNCHGTLATEISGCKGCHFAAHHVDDGPGNVVTGQGDGWYRFLSGAQMLAAVNPGGSSRDALLAQAGVVGVEDANWEQDPTSHNTYKGATGFTSAGFGSVNGNSIGLYCTGCHSRFHHSMGGADDGLQNASGAWIRHPSDVVLPGAGTEYANYNYTALAPVAYETIDSTGAGTTALVTCISCHRPHGSPYPDMLRWDYSGCVANAVNTECGCFACHTSKDGVVP
ncbi:MAG: cytochrome c3 family protein [Deltaproteobacteria bacterium]|nr:cytochrome c3 family protein [Deltaproteobacteria bacterium]